MANRNKNTKYPWDTDKSLQKAIPAPEEPKSMKKRRSARYCIKLKGDHDFDFERESVHVWHDEGGAWIMLYYRCTGCGKKEYLSYDEP